MTHLGAFVGIAAIVIVTPGQDTVLTIRNSLFGGRRGGIATALGVSCGQLVWAVAASAGLAALLHASEPAFDALRLAGAGYLAMLGLRSVRAAVRPSAAGAAFAPTPGPPCCLRVPYRQGLISNLGNPKMAMFFTGLLPQFTGSGRGSFLAMLVLGGAFASLTLVWLAGYAVAVVRASRVLQRSRVRRALDAVSGVALMGLGLRLASEQR